MPSALMLNNDVRDALVLRGVPDSGAIKTETLDYYITAADADIIGARGPHPVADPADSADVASDKARQLAQRRRGLIALVQTDLTPDEVDRYALIGRYIDGVVGYGALVGFGDAS